jgi:hypothetical protein
MTIELSTLMFRTPFCLPESEPLRREVSHAAPPGASRFFSAHRGRYPPEIALPALFRASTGKSVLVELAANALRVLMVRNGVATIVPVSR